MNRKRIVSVVALVLAVIMILGLFMSIIPTFAHAASSAAIKKQLDALKEEAKEIKAEQKELKAQQKENASATKDIVEQKLEIEAEIKLIHDEIDNINAQIQTYNALIVEKQKELDDATAQQEALSEQYSARIRAMEKNGNVSYWSVLFQSRSFAEFLSNLRMMEDIARADEAMMAELDAAAQAIVIAQEELNLEKQGLNEQRAALNEVQAELDAKNAEATLLLDELNDRAHELAALEEKYEAMEDDLSKDIAKKEKEYTEAKKKEQAAQNPGGSGSAGSTSGWGYPLPYRAKITSAYGYRYHPKTGKYSFHTGVDLAASKGTPIYAMRDGTVTTAGKTTVWGNYVVINHGDGYSSLYAHMTRYTVSYGQEVKKGQLIGYVGSTGWSTGPHLHLTIYYNGSTVNPAKYLG